MSDEIYLTRAGFERLLGELEDLKKDRIKISGAIEEARLQGDLSENAEYDAAKEAQAHNVARSTSLEDKLAKTRIIEDEDIPSDKIFIGAIATLKDVDTGEELKYQLLSPEEADFDAGKISIHSPIGKGLLGHTEGEEVNLQVPAGTLTYKILKIKRPK